MCGLGEGSCFVFHTQWCLLLTQCSEIACVWFNGSYGVPGSKPGLAMSNASTLLTVLLFQAC